MIENQLLLRVPWLLGGGGGVGYRRRGKGGSKSCCPIQNFLEATLKQLRARLLQWQNCPGGRALLTQIMSLALTGRETYGREEWGMGETKIKFFSIQDWDLST